MCPVVQWTTVCRMPILENILGLRPFLHTTLGQDEKVYGRCFLVSSNAESLRFFVSRKLFMICVNVLMPSEISHWKTWYLWPTLSSFWPLPYYWKKVIAICFVDVLIFWERNEKDIVDLTVQLLAKGVDLKQGDDAARSLGVHIECNPKTGFLNMTQKSLIKKYWKLLALMLELHMENYSCQRKASC